MSNIKVLVVEEDLVLSDLYRSYLFSIGIAKVLVAHNKTFAYKLLETLQPDLVLLDLYLEEPNDGFEIANFIDQHLGIPYIFITDNTGIQLLNKALSTSASAYFTKPVKKEDLQAAIQIALRDHKGSSRNSFHIKDGNTNHIIALKELLYIESNGNYLHFYTKKQKFISRQSLDLIAQQLPTHQFIRVHRSFLVNIHSIDRINPKNIFIGDKAIPISRANASKISNLTKL